MSNGQDLLSVGKAMQSLTGRNETERPAALKVAAYKSDNYFYQIVYAKHKTDTPEL
jgi:hypothetical protein